MPPAQFARLLSLLDARGGPTEAPLALRIAVCSAIAALCEQHDDNRVAAGEACVRAVVGMLRGSAGSVPLCASALRATRWLAGGLTFATKCDANIAAFLAADGLDPVFNAMRTFAADASVCEWACAALFALARPDEALVRFVSSDGLD